MAIIDVDTAAEYVTAANTYSDGDTVNLRSLTYDLSGESSNINWDNGSVHFTSPHTTVAIMLGYIGVVFTGNSGGPEQVITSNNNVNITYIRTGVSTVDNNVLTFNNNGGLQTLELYKWVADGDSIATTVEKSAWRFEGTGTLCVANLTDCGGINSTNDGFSGNGAWTINLLGPGSNASGNTDEAFSPHDTSVINSYDGTYTCTAAAGNVVGLGTGVSASERPIANIYGGTFTGTGCIAVLNAGGGFGEIHVNEPATLAINTSGFMCDADSNTKIVVHSGSTLTVGSGCSMWDEDASENGSLFRVWASTIVIPTFSATQMMDRLFDTCHFIGTTFDMEGSTIDNAVTLPRAGQTWSFWDCKFKGGDFAMANSNSPAFTSFQGTVNFRRCIADLSEWTTHSVAHYRGFVGASDAVGVTNVEGCVFYDLPAAGGTKYRVPISFMNGDGEAIHNTLRCEASSTFTMGIQAATGVVLTDRGNIVTGGFTYPRFYQTTTDYTGSYNWSTGAANAGNIDAPGIGDLEGGSDPVFINPTPATIDAAADGFRLNRDQDVSELLVLGVDPESAHQIAANAQVWTPLADPAERMGPLDLGAVAFVFPTAFRRPILLQALRGGLRDQKVRPLPLGM